MIKNKRIVIWVILGVFTAWAVVFACGMEGKSIHGKNSEESVETVNASEALD